MQRVANSIVRQRIPPLFIIVALLWSMLSAGYLPEVSASRAHRSGALVSIFKGNHFAHWLRSAPPSDDVCRASGQLCYSPQEMQTAYNLTPVLSGGYTGVGQTIVIIDSFGSPTALADLHHFDTDYGLPDPPSFQQIAPLGTVPFDPNNTDHVGWAEETSLDIQWAHAMAPGANIVVLTSPVSETQGVQGMPEFFSLEVYALIHHMGQIISQSWGTTENTLFTPGGNYILTMFNQLYELAAAQQVTMLAAAGDSGTANPALNGINYPFPTVVFPASSPWVTAVGGTSLYLDSNGGYQNEVAWNNGEGSATGGGMSQYFHAPDYQQGLPADSRALLHGARGLPDIAYNADPATSVPVYLGFVSQPGYYMTGGTSAGSPQWAGVIADANQVARHPLGFLNTRLYAIGSNPILAPRAFHDITVGNNAQKRIGGYNATPGWDAATGWGSPRDTGLIRALLS